LYVGIITDQKGRSSPTGSTPIVGGFTLLTGCAIFDDICNGIIVGLQRFTKRGENTATADSCEHFSARLNRDATVQGKNI
jgi:hypothetical protein